ncbi:MAG TPA: phosphodiester glycosidase family protein [Abditibacteriaceae bacterium]|jgi:exopolysaccharide biosynthesis protein
MKFSLFFLPTHRACAVQFDAAEIRAEKSASTTLHKLRVLAVSCLTLTLSSAMTLAQGTNDNATEFPTQQTTTPAVSPATPAATPRPIAPPPPPLAQAYVAARPPIEVAYGRTMVPVSFLSNGLGASVGPLKDGHWRILYFGHTVDLYPYQQGARFDGRQVTLPTAPQTINDTLYVPWTPLAELFGVRWRIVSPQANPDQGGEASSTVANNAAVRGSALSSRAKTSPVPAASTTQKADATTFLLQYPAAYIQNVRHSVSPERTRITVDLSNATRIVAAQDGLDVQFYLAGARRPNVPTVTKVNDYLVPRAVTRSGDWRAVVSVRLNYSAPVRWFTVGSPPRLVIDLQRLFEEKNTNPIEGGLALTKIRRGTGHGPVQMYVVRVDPRDGWRLRVATGGASVLQRGRPSRIASRHKALVAVNGGFFAYDGAAVGALLINGEWIRLPWKGRTAVGFRPDGTARIGNMQARATAQFGSGLSISVRDLNGWPDKGFVTALTRRFGNYYQLRSGEMAVVVKDGSVVGKPGGGGVHIHQEGFTLIASGAARPWLDKVQRGQRASLKIQPVGWEGFSTALGGGPRLLNNGRVEVTALEEAFRADVRVGLGPRTALGIDRSGRYIIAVVDGRQKFHSTGLTLTEMAYTMQKLGAVDALNLDGGGSTVLAVRSRVVNKPSDGTERSVSNALLVMR